ncbi:protein CASP-like [Mizuhopecten yessoensis]|uniref:protein CASP-like n=1 Tax=Mizuhopecten yessoensis TaxID=6573 RepID=UPI000B45AACE|nr:protein CASP-like [Mizuhopecten yessoensis]
METGGKSAADSLLPIVQSQRERYRLRAQELEAHSLGQQQQVTLLQNEIDKLRSDNVKLFEKIRFLQSYPTKVNSVWTRILFRSNFLWHLLKSSMQNT